MSNKIKNDMNKIPLPAELHAKVLEGVEKAKQEMEPTGNKIKTKKKIKPKKTAYIIGAAAIFLILLIGSISNSPVISAAISEIPVLSKLFNTKPLDVIITEELEKDNYDLSYIDQIGISFIPNRVVTINISGPDGYYEEVNAGLNNSVEQILSEKGYSAFAIEITNTENSGERSFTDSQLNEKEQMEKRISTILSEEKIRTSIIFADPVEKKVHLQIESELSNEEELKKESISVKNLLAEELGDNPYDFHVIAQGSELLIGENVKQLRNEDVQHFRAIALLNEEFVGKEAYEISRIAHNGLEPVNVYIYTTVDSSNTTHGEQLESIIKSYLESEEIASISDVEYNIVVYSKDKKQIN
ncbi:hypothetical protein GLW20_08660 [Virgibacillus halodenitrificans]|nr:hypothetical protein [Virgibacillus halodenitrificans]